MSDAVSSRSIGQFLALLSIFSVALALAACGAESPKEAGTTAHYRKDATVLAAIPG
jgi:hypothetical protein